MIYQAAPEEWPEIHIRFPTQNSKEPKFDNAFSMFSC